ncbi:symmetrical bis(5'-nucleosyl)-tetraphosphatase [Caballeronia sp. INSB1]|uniref:symmetrical bis(5'-nucleosyl)-tetraphosphatase n=1 Tax=Caballeronia sp. INSB1 TaxID=2921751 RepID=UPI002032A986|nr:symmetrical bis(5'-nucleosyl)-tetraphosphatase [Caballeronia sp. INSB1]
MTDALTSSLDLASAPLVFGDLQGCCDPFERLVKKAAPEPGTPLWFAGDLINRGPKSLQTLREVIALGSRATVVLGNHDLNLLSVAAGLRKPKKGDTLDEILEAPDAADLIEWVRHKPVAHFENNVLMVHAGVLPQWDATMTMELAHELEQALRAPNWKETLASLYGNEPHRWEDSLKGADRLRVIYNALSRIRFCTPEGAMEFANNGGPDAAPPGYVPWFDVQNRRTQDVTIVFGHWAALGLMVRENVLCLDSGCVWGNKLSAVLLTADPAQRVITQVSCSVNHPGKARSFLKHSKARD